MSLNEQSCHYIACSVLVRKIIGIFGNSIFLKQPFHNYSVSNHLTADILKCKTKSGCIQYLQTTVIVLTCRSIECELTGIEFMFCTICMDLLDHGK